MAYEIRAWGEIQADFTDTLLLGNGASIAVHGGFKYQNLYGEAVKENVLGDAAAVFKAFGKEESDFELVLRRLWYARQVNEALAAPAESVQMALEAYAKVRSALIRIVQKKHVSYDVATPHFDPIARFVRRFRTVLSLNYDLVLYWALMYGQREELIKFADCFHYDHAHNLSLNPSFSEYRADESTLCFYPHGNLALARSTDDAEIKIAARSGDKLLERIVKAWESGTSSPLFVCEGTSEHKQRAIFASTYLGQIYARAFSEIGSSVVIYGWSMGENDQHIVDQVLLQRPTAIAVSVREKSVATIKRAVELFEGKVQRLEFFDAESPGAWNNSDGTKDGSWRKRRIV
ncbi:MAG: DUF4917 family protein [Cupriavidus sp.]|nr:MAG: DUF4917 family protein [Cupriavidus sp.]